MPLRSAGRPWDFAEPTEPSYYGTSLREAMNVPTNRLNVAMVGLGFGAEFIPIYQALGTTHVAAVCRRNEAELNKVTATRRQSPV